jgi:hypothetical protein
MPNTPEITALTIDQLQAQDKRNQANEVIPEQQTLNSLRVGNFLHSNGIVLSNMDNLFNLDTSIKLAKEGSTETEKDLGRQFTEAKSILVKYHRLDIMMGTAQTTVAGQLENLKTPPTSMSAAEAAKIMQAWNYHNLIRENARRILALEESMKDSRMEQMNPTQDIGETIKDKLHGARENWDKLSGGQKLMFAAIAIFGGAMMLKSDNEYVKGIKETLFTGVKIAGAGWLLNKAWYIFTGESAVDAVAGSVHGSHKSGKFWMESFKTNEAGAEIINHAMVMIGDNSFIDILDRFEAAKAGGKTTLEGTRMPPDEAYKAMEIFTGKYSAELLRKQYANNNPPIAFSQVMIAEMCKDPNVKLKESLAGRILDYGEDKFNRAYNYLASTGGAAWLGKKYKDIFGKEASKEEISDFTKKFSYIIDDPSKFHLTIKSKLAATDRVDGERFVNCDLTGKKDTEFGVKYLEDTDGFTYVIVDKDIGNKITEEKGLSETVQSASELADTFLAKRYGVNVVNVPKKSKVYGSVYIKSNSSMKYLVRYKTK